MPVLSVQLVNVSVNEYKLVSTTVAMKSRGAKEKLREKEMEREGEVARERACRPPRFGSIIHQGFQLQEL